MIQRQQTLWLVLSTAAAILTFMFPFLTGKGVDKTGTVTDVYLKADSSFLLLVCTIGSIILSSVTIFLYKDRKLQMKLTLLGLFIAIIIIALYITQMNKVSKSTLALFAVLPFAILASYYMAFRLIRKDEKLVKSLDKLR